MRNIIIRSALMVLLVVAMVGSIRAVEANDRPVYDPELHVAFVGTKADADCVVVWRKDFAMMIDVGGAKDQTEILDFLSAQKISRLNYLVLLNPDRQELQSAAAIADVVETASLVLPLYQAETVMDRPLQARLGHDRTRVIVLVRSLDVSVNDVTINILPPASGSYEDPRDYSLAAIVRHQDVQMLFLGSAGDVRLLELVKRSWGQIDLYELPRHGQYTEVSRQFLQRLRPAVTVVTSTAADARMTDAGDALGTKWYYSVGDTVAFVSDGSTLQAV